MKVSGPLEAQVFVGLREDQLANYAPVQEIGAGFLFRNSLLPKALGSGVDYGFFELCSLFNNFRKSVGDFRSPYKEMDASKGFAYFFNKVAFDPLQFSAFLLTRIQQDVVRVAVPMGTARPEVASPPSSPSRPCQGGCCHGKWRHLPGGEGAW